MINALQILKHWNTSEVEPNKQYTNLTINEIF